MEGFNWFIIYLKYMESKNEIGFQLIYVFDQWPWLRNPSWLEAPSVREYPQQNMAKHMVLTYLHVLDPEDLPVKNGRFQLSDQVCWWLGGGLERHRRRRPTTEDFSKKYVSGFPTSTSTTPKKLGLSGVEGFTIKQSQFPKHLVSFCNSWAFLAKETLKQNTSGWWFQPLLKIWKSVGVIIPIYYEKKTNHQPDINGCSVMGKGWR